jgi:hypothetical protein
MEVGACQAAIVRNPMSRGREGISVSSAALDFPSHGLCLLAFSARRFRASGSGQTSASLSLCRAYLSGSWPRISRRAGRSGASTNSSCGFDPVQASQVDASAGGRIRRAMLRCPTGKALVDLGGAFQISMPRSSSPALIFKLRSAHTGSRKA